MKQEEMISTFIGEYCKKDYTLGIIFYGSSNYKTNTSNSDLDLLVITDGNCNYKGTVYIEGQKIEYFEKNIYDLIEKIERLPNDADRSLVSIFENGTILYSKNDTVEYLKEEVFARKKYFPLKQKGISQKYQFEELYEFMQQLPSESNSFRYVYYNLLEMIRKRYHEENGMTKLPCMKIYQLYSNPLYATKIYDAILPNQEFMDLFLDLLVHGYNKEKLDLLMDFIHIGNTEGVVQKSFPNYTKVELKYLSTIVKNMVDKTLYYLEINHASTHSCYYITLDRIRRLYCYINQIDDQFCIMNEKYDLQFLELFQLCLSDKEKGNHLEELFCYVVNSLQMDYQNYKILELSY